MALIEGVLGCCGAGSGRFSCVCLTFFHAAAVFLSVDHTRPMFQGCPNVPGHGLIIGLIGAFWFWLLGPCLQLPYYLISFL